MQFPEVELVEFVATEREKSHYRSTEALHLYTTNYLLKKKEICQKPWLNSLCLVSHIPKVNQDEKPTVGRHNKSEKKLGV